MSEKLKTFLFDLAERAVKTFCQTAVAMIGAAQLFSEVDIVMVLSGAGLAMVVSVLTSIGSYNIGDSGTASLVSTTTTTETTTEEE